MRRTKQIKQRVVKGTSSAVVISIAIHAGLFFLAGALVIFKVMNKPEIIFKAPLPAQVPKMRLRKLMPKLKKPSKPKSAAKIVAIVEKVDLNEIQFPEMATSGVVPLASNQDSDWCVKATQTGSFTLEWEQPVDATQIIYYARVTSPLLECFKDYEVYLDDAEKPVVPWVKIIRGSSAGRSALAGKATAAVASTDRPRSWVR